MKTSLIHKQTDCLMRARCFLLPGIKIGAGSLVSAGTVIYKDVPNGVLAFGSPLQFKELKKKATK